MPICLVFKTNKCIKKQLKMCISSYDCMSWSTFNVWTILSYNYTNKMFFQYVHEFIYYIPISNDWELLKSVFTYIILSRSTWVFIVFFAGSGNWKGGQFRSRFGVYHLSGSCAEASWWTYMGSCLLPYACGM